MGVFTRFLSLCSHSEMRSVSRLATSFLSLFALINKLYLLGIRLFLVLLMGIGSLGDDSLKELSCILNISLVDLCINESLV